MEGQKQLFTLIVILIVITTFTFFRNGIRKEKEFKRIREEALRKKLESILADNEAEIIKIETDEGAVSLQTKNYMYKFLEYKDICYDLHAIVFKPEKQIPKNQEFNSKLIENEVENDHKRMKNEEKEKVAAGQFTDSKHTSSVITGPVIYLVIIILIYSFVKAATDMSKQLTKKNSEDESGTRKCSLKEYAGTSKRSRRSSKVLKRATTVTVEPRLSTKQQSLEERRKSYILSELHNGTPLAVEVGTVPKAINGIGMRPAPLLRRCSVPAFALQSGHGSVLRRPSVDSHSEDDSSPDMKRRVRMIHRH